MQLSFEFCFFSSSSLLDRLAKVICKFFSNCFFKCKRCYPLSHVAVPSYGLARLCDKLKSFYLLCHSAYGHQTWWDGDLLSGVSSIKSYKAFISWSCKVRWRKKPLYPYYKSGYDHHKVTWPFDHVTKLYNIFTTTELMANKLGTIVTYVEGLLTIKSFNGLIKWPCKVTWQTETIIFPPRVPTATKLGRVMKRLPHIKLIYLAWRGLARSRDKLKSLHLHCYSAYDHQTLRSF